MQLHFRSYLPALAVVAVLGTRPAGAQPLPDRVPMSGEIRDQDGALLAGVVLSIRRQDDTGTYAFWGAETSTDPKGRFRFPDAEEGRYYLNAEKPGYAQLLNQSVTWNSREEPLRLRMERMARIKLRVLQPDGNVMKNGRIFFRLRGDPNNGPSYRRLMTDGSGMVLMEDLPPAQYSFQAIAPGVGNAKLEDIAGKYAADPTPIEMRLQPGGTVRIKVVSRLTDGAPDKPMGGAQIMLVPTPIQDANSKMTPVLDPNENIGLLTSQSDRSSLITRDGEGTLTLSDLPPGRYSARLYMPGWPQQPVKSVDVSANESVELEWSLTVRASASLTLNVRGTNGKPVENQELVVRMMALGPQEPEENQEPLPTETEPQAYPGAGGSRRGVTDAEGKLTLYPLRPGRYRMWVAPWTSTRGQERRGAVSVEGQATAAGGSVDVTLPQGPTKP